MQIAEQIVTALVKNQICSTTSMLEKFDTVVVPLVRFFLQDNDQLVQELKYAASGMLFEGANYHLVTPDLSHLCPSSDILLRVQFAATSYGVVVDELGQEAVNTNYHDSNIEILPDGTIVYI